MTELWDLYDENRTPLGKTAVRGKHEGCSAYHVVVFIAVKNGRGEYLITKRAPEKNFGGMWEFTGGSALAGEESEAAALRETLEETGIDHKNSKRTFIGTMKIIWDDGDAGWHGDFDDMWLFRADFPIEDVKLQAGETTDVRWAGKDELIKMAENGEFASNKAIKMLFGYTERN